MRLFCFPFGGGGASVYHSWPEAMGEAIEVRALQLPGRESRFREPMTQDMDAVLRQTVQALANYRDKPFAMFGYSLGALLAFEACRELRRQGLGSPRRLFVAALGAPQLPPPHAPISMLDDDAFVEKVEYYYQPDNEAWENRELREFLLPLLRNDIALYESYRYRDDAPLDCPIDVFAGDADRATPVDTTRQWSQQTSAEMRHEVFAGGHFFIEQALGDIQRRVRDALLQSP